MSKRYGVLYIDGSMNLCPDGRDLERARRELKASTDDGDTQLVEVDIKIIKMFGPKEAPVIYDHSVDCPTCGTEIPINHPTPNKAKGDL